MAEIVLVNPRFEVSFWGLEHVLPILGKRANVPTAALPLLAALTPPPHRVTLVDENVEPIDFERLARADIVGLTGMNVQRKRMVEILKELKRRGVFAVVGGPWVSVREDYFGELADAIFVGEAEQTWPQFLVDWENGNRTARYEPSQPTDMGQVPPPRYDLLKTRRYLFGSVQISRGCPFQCEFCDIFVTFGRRPRLKNAAQVLAELDALRACGQTIVFIVDDNLVGNRRAITGVLEEIAAWQEANGYPLTFFTEASLNLAEDAALMEAMVRANIQTVFVGIESPNEAALRETKKLQNLRSDRTLVDRVRAIQNAGMDVWCGMILGFDHDDHHIFAAHRRFLEEARVLHAMVGMLTAIPKTPLYSRLKAEGRLDLEHEDVYGTNVVPRGMSREELRDGYLQLMRDLYEPEAYFRRFEDLMLDRGFRFGQARSRHWRKRPWTWLRGQAASVLASAMLAYRLLRRIPDRGLRREYTRRMLRLLRHRPDPAVLFVGLVKCAVHYHHHTLAEEMAKGQTVIRNSF